MSTEIETWRSLIFCLFSPLLAPERDSLSSPAAWLNFTSHPTVNNNNKNDAVCTHPSSKCSIPLFSLACHPQPTCRCHRRCLLLHHYGLVSTRLSTSSVFFLNVLTSSCASRAASEHLVWIFSHKVERPHVRKTHKGATKGKRDCTE